MSAISGVRCREVLLYNFVFVLTMFIWFVIIVNHIHEVTVNRSIRYIYHGHREISISVRNQVSDPFYRFHERANPSLYDELSPLCTDGPQYQQPGASAEQAVLPLQKECQMSIANQQNSPQFHCDHDLYLDS